MRPLAKRRVRKGFTLLEVIFTSAILLAVMVGLISLYVALLQKERSNIRLLQMSYNAADLHRQMRRASAVGGSILATDDGFTVEFVNRDTGNNARLAFIDPDGDPDTIKDNRIELDLNTASDDDTKVLVKYVSPLPDLDNPGEDLPVFQRGIGFRAPVMVNFRIGDRTKPADRREEAAAIADDAITGPGFQSLVFRGAYGARNDG